ncbi:MAG: CapA family protein, partial [bacterium]
DYCEVSFLDTLKNLASSSLGFVGGGKNETDAYSYKIAEVGSLKIGLLAYTEFGEKYLKATDIRPGLAIIDKEKMCKSIIEAKTQTDLVVVSFHFGTEYAKQPNIYQRENAELAIDCGADLIVGHHPHVTQPLEYYAGKPIVYSLGNFIFDQNFSVETMAGNILSVTIKNKQMDKVELIPYKLNKFFQPEVVKF